MAREETLMASVLLKVNSDEIRKLNRSFGGMVEITGNLDSTFASAQYAKSFWEKVAIVVRSIAGGHLFDNGNKRTAFESVKLFKRRNEVVTGTNDTILRETVRLVAIGELTGNDEIAAALRGF
jgi:prophage maintenance system killer protein